MDLMRNMCFAEQRQLPHPPGSLAKRERKVVHLITSRLFLAPQVYFVSCGKNVRYPDTPMDVFLVSGGPYSMICWLEKHIKS